MPCYYTVSAEGNLRLAAEQSEAENARIISELTQHLCFVMERWHAAEYITDLNKEITDNKQLMAWWNAHQTADRKRKDELRNQALAKLTREEKEALGL